MQQVDWDKAASEFSWDGSFRDIFVIGATISDWENVLKMICEIEPEPVYSEDHIAMEMPENLKTIFERRNMLSPRLDFFISDFLLQCFFFGSPTDYGDIEFTLDPREMKSIDQLKQLVNFMSRLILLTKKTVVLTHENSQDMRIIEGVLHSDEIFWTTKSWMPI